MSQQSSGGSRAVASGRSSALGAPSASKLRDSMAPSPGGHELEGWLLLRSRAAGCCGGLVSWKRRWFVVDRRAGTLGVYQFHDPRENSRSRGSSSFARPDPRHLVLVSEALLSRSSAAPLDRLTAQGRWGLSINDMELATLEGRDERDRWVRAVAGSPAAMSDDEGAAAAVVV